MITAKIVINSTSQKRLVCCRFVITGSSAICQSASGIFVLSPPSSVSSFTCAVGSHPVLTIDDGLNLETANAPGTSSSSSSKSSSSSCIKASKGRASVAVSGVSMEGVEAIVMGASDVPLSSCALPFVREEFPFWPFRVAAAQALCSVHHRSLRLMLANLFACLKLCISCLLRTTVQNSSRGR
jgi:hypothetical protein